MRRRVVLTPVLVAICVNLLSADWKIRTVTSTSHGKSESTEYFKDGLRRIEQRRDFRSAVQWPTMVFDLNRRREVIWDTNLHQYVVLRLRQNATNRQSLGREMVINRVTVDTGERRTLFGRVARHLLTEETLDNGQAASASRDRTKIDGWYIDSEFLPREKRGTVVSLFLVGSSSPRIKVNQTGPAPSGIAVREVRVQILTLPKGEPKTSKVTSEITELDEALLSKQLFKPPAGYQRVIMFPGDSALPWQDRVRLEWERLEDWVSGS